ncbi:hypothetical protein QT06_C0001G0556 [archaeon GW2011_AR15]|nr:hypothetical protein QT06_C0001G0556 [archaeon GW2011_AR15]MBS3103867.1 hypothetical protein [Candidatus Woesearchaeota archaeon]
MIGEIDVRIGGVDDFGVSELVENLNSIENLRVYGRIQESFLKFKEVATNLIFVIGVGVASELVAHYIIRFFEKTKSKTKKPIEIIINNNVIITQGDTKIVIENKLKSVFDK